MAKNSSAAKKPAFVPKPIKEPLTLKQLENRTGTDGYTMFTVTHPLTDILTAFGSSGHTPHDMLHHEVEKLACPDDTYVISHLTFTPFDFDKKKGTVTLLARAIIHQKALPADRHMPHPESPTAVVAPADLKPDNLTAEAHVPEHHVPDKLNTVTGQEGPTEVPIKATAFTVTGGKRDEEEVNFDCAPWFAQAADSTILGVVRDQFKQSDRVDQATTFCAALNDGLYRPLSTFIEENDTWFSAIDAVQAMEWISKFRPHLLEGIKSIQHPQTA